MCKRGELPPRARRIPSRSKQVTRTHGTTSACAENTRRRGRWGFSHRNYLRVRGEYPPVRSWQPPLRELPPRARRIRRDCLYGHAQHGTTSACAENTRSDRGGALFVGNYLRVRGEYALLPELFLLKSELPPRARRIPGMLPRRGVCGGTTSACAENTFCPTLDTRAPRNYLRVRGEYTMADRMDQYLTELPPRARRIPIIVDIFTPFLGTTSACAENTTAKNSTFRTRRNYLRVRGEYVRVLAG